MQAIFPKKFKKNYFFFYLLFLKVFFLAARNKQQALPFLKNFGVDFGIFPIP
jgi:hypothetical protein